MNSDQLEQFTTIAECESITKAAEVLYLSQPALSKTLKNLETELGCRLFYRSHHKLKITKEGKRLLEYARVVNTTLDTAKQEFNSYDNTRKIRLHSTGYYLPALLEGYYEEHISHLEMHVTPDENILNMLINHHADAVIADDYYLRHYATKDLDRIQLFQEQLVMVLPSGHNWFFRGWIPLKEIQAEPMLYIEMPADTDSWIQEILKLNRCTLNVKLRLETGLFNQMRDKLYYPYLISSSAFINGKNDLYYKNRNKIRVNGLYTSRYIYLWFYKKNYKNLSHVIDTIKKNAAELAEKIEIPQEVVLN